MGGNGILSDGYGAAGCILYCSRSQQGTIGEDNEAKFVSVEAKFGQKARHSS